MKETTGDMQIPTNLASFLKRDDRSVLKEAENLFSVRVKLVKDKYDCDVTNLVIIERPAGSLVAQRFLLDKLATTQWITECLYGDDVISLKDSWSESKLLDFEKQNQVSVVAVESQDCNFVLLKGWNRGRLTVAKRTLEKMAREYARTRDTVGSQSDESDYSDSDEESSLDDSDNTSDSSSNGKGNGSSKSELEESESDSDYSPSNRGRRDDIGNDVKKCRKRPEAGGDSTEHSKFDIGDVMERLDEMSASLVNLTQMVQELGGKSEIVTKEPPMTVLPSIETSLSNSVDPPTTADAAADSCSLVTNLVKPADSSLCVDDRSIGKVPAMSQDNELTTDNGDVARLNDVSTVAAQPVPTGVPVPQNFAGEREILSDNEEEKSMESAASDGEFDVLTLPELGTPSENSQPTGDYDREEVANDDEEDSGDDGVVVEDLHSDKDDSVENETPVTQSQPIVNTYYSMSARVQYPVNSKRTSQDVDIDDQKQKKSWFGGVSHRVPVTLDVTQREVDSKKLDTPFPNVAHIFKARKTDITNGVKSQPSIVSAAHVRSSNSGNSFVCNNVSDSAVYPHSPLSSAIAKSDASDSRRQADVDDSQKTNNRHSNRRQLDSDSSRFRFDSDSKRNTSAKLSFNKMAKSYSKATIKRSATPISASGGSSSCAVVTDKAFDLNKKFFFPSIDPLRSTRYPSLNVRARPLIPSSATAVSARPATTTKHRNRQQSIVTNDTRSVHRHISSSYWNRGSAAADRQLKAPAECAASKINSELRRERFSRDH